ncbi:dihydrofolate reductase family protein [Thermoactinospora rubra]|uniref:dihydrofolate reductase family protein n=1 Tax=Thermoactinospora rubra TaxID=1088767 RepID=UPI000A11F3EF|nr:dihydrofolate reductase family protein [Thermoactinospora rubra]
MRKLVYYVGVSIDGYIAGPGHDISFFPLPDDMLAWIGEEYPETLPTHVRPHLGLADAPNRHFDTLVMGRGTYEPGLAINVTSPYAHVKQYVVSRTLTGIDDPAVEFVKDDPLGLVRELKRQDGMDVWLAGGGRLAAALLPEIDELVVKSYPVVAANGTRAFDGDFQPTPFTPTATRTFSNGAQVTWFARR